MSTTENVVIANTSFSAGTRAVTKGETFRASHPVVQGREELFDPFVVDNDVEQATAAPGERRRRPTPEPSQPEKADTTKTVEPADYSELKQPELKALCDQRGIKYPTGVVSNANLIKLLQAADETVE
jgi:hypothetical protein